MSASPAPLPPKAHAKLSGFLSSTRLGNIWVHTLAIATLFFMS